MNTEKIPFLTNFVKSKFYLEIGLAVILFAIALYTGNIIEFIILMLYFIIFLEIVRSVVGFVREQRVMITPLINAFIVLTLREFIVTVVKINKEESESFEAFFNSAVNFQLLVFSGVLLFLFLLRYLAYRTSPDRLNSHKS